MAHKPIKSLSYGLIGTVRAGSDSVPISTEEIGTRISATASALGTREVVAKMMGVSPAQLQRYIKGENMLPFDAAARLCFASGIAMEWLATGVSPATEAPVTPSQSMSQENLTLALQLVEEVALEHRLPMPPQRKAELTMAVAELLEDGVPEAKVLRFVRATTPA